MGTAFALILLSGCACDGGYTGEAKARWDATHQAQASAMELARGGRYDESADAWIALWREGMSPRPGGPNLYFVAVGVRDLVERSPETRTRFDPLLGEYERLVHANRAGAREFKDWIRLIDVTGQAQGLVRFVESHRARRDVLDRLPDRGRAAFYPLIRAGRWDLAGVAVRSPAGEVRRMRTLQQLGTSPIGIGLAVVIENTLAPMMAPRMSPEGTLCRILKPGEWERIHAGQDESLRDVGSPLYAAALAAGRTHEADRVAVIVQRARDKPAARLALIEEALRAGQARTVHLEWLAANAAVGRGDPALERRVRRALESGS